ncbi:MAG: EamA family transporter [Solirubrobacterales bacterium]
METNLNNENRKVILAYIAVCILWGSTYLAIRVGVGELPPTIFAGVRFLIAGSLMFCFASFKGLSMPKNISEVIKISIVGFLLLTCGNGSIVWAETHISSGMASLMIAVGPLFTAIIEWIIPGGAKMNKMGWLGLFIGFSGVAVLVFTDLSSSSMDVFGVTMAIISSLTWSLGSIYSKKVFTNASTVTIIAIQMLAGGLFLSIIGSFMGELSILHISPKGIMSILYLIIFGSLIGYSCYIYILEKWPAAKAATYAYVNPPVAVILGVIFLGEKITLKIVIASIIILSGVILVQTSKKSLVTN